MDYNFDLWVEMKNNLAGLKNLYTRKININIYNHKRKNLRYEVYRESFFNDKVK